MKSILDYLIKYSTKKINIFILPFIIALEAATLIFFTSQLVPIVNSISKGAFSETSYNILLYFLFIGTYIFLKFLRQLLIDLIAIDNEKNVWGNAVNNISKMRPEQIYMLGKGTVASILSNELLQNKRFIILFLYEFIYEPLVFVFSIMYIYSINALLSYIMIPMMLSTVFISYFSSKKLSVIYSGKNEDTEKLMTTQREIFANISTLKLYGCDDFFCDLNRKISTKLYLDEKKYANHKAKNYFMSLINEYMPTIITIILSILLMRNISLNIGQFISVLQLLAMVSLPFSKYAETIIEARNTLVTIHKLDNIFSGYDSDITKKNDMTDVLLEENYIVNISHLSYEYDKKKVLEDCSLQVKKGEHIGIIGLSGVGKTTLLSIILGFLPKYEGSVRLFGYEVNRIDPELLFSKISYVDQNRYFLSENILLNISAGQTNIPNEKMQHVIEMTNLTDDIETKLTDGLNTILVNGGTNLSGGQKEKISIARALYKQSDLFIFDEPSSALDEETEQCIVKSLDAFKDTTMIIVSHRLSTLEKCDRILCLKNGALYEKATI